MFFKLINHIKLAVQQKRKLIKIQINKNEMNLIKLLIQLNYINFLYKPEFKKKKKFDNYYYVSVNTSHPLNNIKNMYRTVARRTITYRELSRITLNKNQLVVISTSKGLFTNNLAMKYKIGGVLILNLSY